MFQVDSMVIARRARGLRSVLILLLFSTVAIEVYALCSELPLAMLAMPAGRYPARWTSWWCDLLSGMAVSAGLTYLARTAGALSRAGKILPQVTHNLRSFAYCILVAAASTSILPVGILLAQRALGLSDGSSAKIVGSDLLLLLLAGVLVPITHLLDSASLAQDELDRIV